VHDRRIGKDAVPALPKTRLSQAIPRRPAAIACHSGQQARNAATKARRITTSGLEECKQRSTERHKQRAHRIHLKTASRQRQTSLGPTSPHSCGLRRLTSYRTREEADAEASNILTRLPNRPQSPRLGTDHSRPWLSPSRLSHDFAAAAYARMGR
jgi:hypothetical protein